MTDLLPRMTVAALVVLAAASPGALAQEATAAIAPPPVRSMDAPAGFEALIGLIEGALGRPLAEDERTRCEDAARRASAALRERDLMFLHAVADLLRLSPEQLTAMAPSGGIGGAAFERELRPRIESALGRRLGPRERERIRAVDAERRQWIAPLRDALARELAEAIDAEAARLRPLLPHAGF
ncbi:hypothetical protein [Arenibaculum sp.]|jgi:hypothetical protein|uniref:hypothetical protein n=1 Tax=Arenibaculum sp. TaxID=2865862 RepID=UPI002E0EF724|nr:hypothetical protein [Arenibaculum sp.]